MIVYLSKTILCSALLLLIYSLFFEKEKMYRFNRFYLLFGIAFSFAIPFITITARPPAVPVLKEVIPLFGSNSQPPIFQQAIAPVQESNYLLYCLPICYLLVTAFLLLQFIRNMIAFSATIKRSASVPYCNANLVLVLRPVVPHSFLTYIFLDKEEYEKGRIEQEIIRHELTHVRQRHSADILFLELLRIFLWFHPVLYFYRKAIQLNHEFLADEAVIRTFDDIPAYQQILLERAGRTGSVRLASRFNYSITKKRFMMMPKTTSYKTIILKQALLLPLVAAVTFLFCTKIAAQDTTAAAAPRKQPSQHDTLIKKLWVGLPLGSTKEGVSEELLQEYASIINKYRKPGSGWWNELHKTISGADKNRLEAIFRQMNQTQQQQQTVLFVKLHPPKPPVAPTKKQFESFKNPAVYGVWIDNKKADNAVLGKYQHTDFAQTFVSKLYGAAKKHVSYFYQVDLETREYYRKQDVPETVQNAIILVLNYGNVEKQENSR